MADLDREKAGRKVWVVRVPPYVAKQWREALAAAEKLPVDEYGETPTLGHLMLEEGNPTTLKVKGPDGEQQLLYMNPNRDAVDTTIMSYEPAADGSMLTPRVEGVVSKRFDAAPVKLSDVGRTPTGLTAEQRKPAPGAQVDDSYLATTRKRLAAAAKPQQKRKLAMLEDDREMAELASGTKDAPLYVRNRGKKVLAASVKPRKREKMSKDELEEELFTLFGEQQHWHFTQIQKTLEQPIASLKEVLIQVADQVKRGPNKDLWELKPHLRKSAAVLYQQRQAALAAAAGPAAAAAAAAAGDAAGS